MTDETEPESDHTEESGDNGDGGDDEHTEEDSGDGGAGSDEEDDEEDTEEDTEDSGDGGHPPGGSRLEELKDDIEAVRRRAEDADLIPDDDEAEDVGSGESADEDDRTAPPG